MLDLLYSKFQEMTARVTANGSFTVLLGMEARTVTELKNKWTDLSVRTAADLAACGPYVITMRSVHLSFDSDQIFFGPALPLSQ